jgi:hypothetical protein
MQALPPARTRADDDDEASGSAGELVNTAHPRFGQRLQTCGAILLVIGGTVHFANLHAVVLAGSLLVPGLLAVSFHTGTSEHIPIASIKSLLRQVGLALTKSQRFLRSPA